MTRCSYCGGDDHGPNQCSDQPPAAPVEREQVEWREGPMQLVMAEIERLQALVDSHSSSAVAAHPHEAPVQKAVRELHAEIERLHSLIPTDKRG